jgi:hypothetical protein
MAISIDWATQVITVPQADLTFITGTLYELDTEQFRLDLKALEASEFGQPFPDTHIHNTEVTVAGVTYARFIEITNGYTVTFEDGQYAVSLVGSNNNIFEEGIINRNQVSVISNNSAGLIVGSDVSASGLAVAVWDRLLATHSTSGSAGETLRTLEKIFTNDAVVVFNGGTGENEVTIYDDDGITVLRKMSITTDGLTRTVLVGS